MIDILNLKPVQINKDLRGKYILIYGQPKIGKTTLAAQFPKNLLLAFEPGYNALNNKMVQPIGKWSDFKTVLRQLEKPEAQEMYNTITIDTADIAWDYCEKYICAANPSEDGETPKTLGDIPWGKGYDLCKKEFDSALRKIAILGYGLVIISHETTKKMQDNSGQEYLRFVPTLADRPRLIVNRLVDIIAYLRLSDEDGKRYMYTRGNKNFEAGSRFQYLQPKLEMTYDNLVEELYKAIEQQAKEDGTELGNAAEGNSFFKKGREFDDVINEAKEVFTKLISEDKEKNGVLTNEILLKTFGKPTKLSETTPDQQELVEIVLDEWKALLK